MDDPRTRQRIAIASVLGALLLSLLLTLGLIHGRRASAAPSPSECVSYLAVARDLHLVRLWYLGGEKPAPSPEFDEMLRAWSNILGDTLVVKLAYGKPVLDERGWEILWIARYNQCLSELSGPD